MRMLVLHSERIWIMPRKKAIKDLPDIEEKPVEARDCLVIMTAFESSDESGDPVPEAVKEIKEIAEKLGRINEVVVYPYVHLTNEPSSIDYARKALDKFSSELKKAGFSVKEAPFGYYKEFDLHVKGHPLAEWSRTIYPGKREEETGEEEEGEMEELFVIMPDGKIRKREEIKDKEVEMAIKAELKEIKESRMGKPPHLELMRRLEIADYEEISDAGNLRYYPNGAFMLELLAELGRKMAVEDLGAMPVKTPYIINPNHPSVKIMMEKFPERTYRVLPGSREKKQEFRLRPACDYGVWSIFKDAVITYKNLPFGLYELDIMWRYEQRGELLGMHRIRNAHMPNLHEVCKDLDQAFDRFKAHIEKFALALYRYLDMKPSVMVLNCKRDFYEDHEEVFKSWAKDLAIPIIVKLFKKMKTYKVAWIDVIAFDNLGRPMEIDTVQLDTVSADWWGIHFIDENGKEKKPVILHTGFGIDRTLAAILENAYGLAKKGKPPCLPLWLSPIQLRIIPVSDKHLEHCLELAKKARDMGIRVDVNDKGQPLGKKIREAERQWIPYIAVVGDKEIESGKLNVRARIDNANKELSLEELVKEIKERTKGLPWLPSPFPIRLSKRPIFVASS